MIASAKMQTAPAAKRVDSGAVSRRRIGAPSVEDTLAAGTALALDLSVTQVKHLARAGSISGQRASEWRKEGKGSPLYDLTLVVYRLAEMGQHPGAIIAHLLTTMHHAFQKLNDEELLAGIRAGLEREAHKEGAENAETATLAWHGDLERVERAMLDEASTQLELAGMLREARRRRLDIRQA